MECDSCSLDTAGEHQGDCLVHLIHTNTKLSTVIVEQTKRIESLEQDLQAHHKFVTEIERISMGNVDDAWGQIASANRDRLERELNDMRLAFDSLQQDHGRRMGELEELQQQVGRLQSASDEWYRLWKQNDATLAGREREAERLREAMRHAIGCHFQNCEACDSLRQALADDEQERGDD